MAEAILFCIAEEVLKNLGSTAVNHIASAWGFKARLKKLKNTINTLKDVLLDAEDKQTDSCAVRGWLESLTTVVYAADDLFDEFNTVASRRRQLMGGNKVATKVQTFFSSSNQIKFAFRISRKIKSIRKELDCIITNGKKFDFVHSSHKKGRVVNRTMRDQTYSFVDVDEVIGRDDDKKVILDTLIASSSTDKEQLTVIPIVGMGGMGKTTLAQLIYNDPRVKEYFEMRLWVCVSEVFDIKEITEKILKSTTTNTTEILKLDMEQLQSQLRKDIGDKKYLLVLDDVWNENREKWLELKALLKVGRKGSKIVVTTRSREVAKIMGTLPFHELQGLSEKKSWDLFERVAFEPGQAQQNSHLVNVGQEIVKKCANVPLAIRALGSLLYGEDDEDRWLSFKDKSLAKISGNNGSIIINDILKLSYHHLWSPLKNCFAYCALFPKDYVFTKEMLIDLWMAEGFISPVASEGQSPDSVAEEYFLTLLQRGFFQDISKSEWGAITSCKMHDLIHDLAQEVAGVKCKVAKSGESDFDDKILHLSFAYHLTSLWEIPSGMLKLKLLRTFLLPEQINDGTTLSKSICLQITRISCLRVLDLHNLRLKSLPCSIGKLIHLRFLDVSRTYIEELPDSVTDLHNLQTLILHWCQQLRTLPENIRKLANLRSLDVDNCFRLTHIPSGLAGFTSLNRLPKFIVNHKNCPELRYKPNNVAKLSDLKELNNLRGDLHIEIHRNLEESMVEAKEASLISKKGLTELKLNFRFTCKTGYNDGNIFEVVLESLKPHCNLRKLQINGYGGEKFPSWARMENLCNTLPKLVVIVLEECTSCKQFPVFSKLRFLKCLKIKVNDSVEYMENGVEEQEMHTSFFPSLEELVLIDIQKLKGWWKMVETIASKNNSSEDTSSSELLPLQFCNLSKLTILDCPELKILPLCLKLETLKLKRINESLSVLKTRTKADLKLKKLEIDDVENQILSIPKQRLHQLSSLTISYDDRLVSTESLGEVFATQSSSLRSLKFKICNNLRNLSKGLECLTALEELGLWYCQGLDLVSLNEPDRVLDNTKGNLRNVVMPWKALKGNLRSLELYGIPKLVCLPFGLQQLINLRSLELRELPNLRELPEWMSSLSSLEYLSLILCNRLTALPEAFRNLNCLNHLKIIGCGGLTERCRRPNGGECPKFQHVPFVYVEDRI